MKNISKFMYLLARIGKKVVSVAIPIIVLIMISTPYIVKDIDVVNGKVVSKWEASGNKIKLYDLDSNSNQDSGALEKIKQ